MKNNLFLLFILCLTQVSCDIFNSENKEEIGDFITSEINTNWLNLIWSKSSDEIITGGSDGIHAIDINTKDMRIIQKCPTFAMQLSDDGSTIYYLEGHTLQGDVEPLYSISLNGQDKKLLIDEVYVDCFCICPHKLNIAYKYNTIVDEDSVNIFNTQDETNQFLCKGVPKVFSPDGKQLICATFQGANPEYFIINIETTEITPLNLEEIGIDETYHSFIVTFKWLDDGIYILYSLGEPEIFYVHNYTINKKAYSWKIPPYGSCYFCWADDAKKVGYWRWKHPYNNLYVADARGVSKELSVEEYYIGNITFSPDNKKMAYVIGNSIYMKNI